MGPLNSSVRERLTSRTHSWAGRETDNTKLSNSYFSDFTASAICEQSVHLHCDLCMKESIIITTHTHTHLHGLRGIAEFLQDAQTHRAHTGPAIVLFDHVSSVSLSFTSTCRLQLHPFARWVFTWLWRCCIMGFVVSILWYGVLCAADEILKFLKRFLFVMQDGRVSNSLWKRVWTRTKGSHPLRLSVGGVNAHTAEPQHAASAAAGRQQLLDDGFVLLLQRQHDSQLQGVHTWLSLYQPPQSFLSKPLWLWIVLQRQQTLFWFNFPSVAIQSQTTDCWWHNNTQKYNA